MSWYERNASTGALTFVDLLKDGVGGVDGLNGASGVILSSDGSRLYVASVYDDSVVEFERNTTSGSLTSQGKVRNGVNGANGLNGANSTSISHDGKHAYVAGYLDDALSWYEINASTGSLSFSGWLKNGFGGVSGLDGANVFALSAVRCFTTLQVNSNALSWYERNGSTGALTFIGVLTDTVNGVDGLEYATCVVLSADDKHAYATALNDDSISWYERNASTGALTYLGMLKDGTDGVDGLDGAGFFNAIAFSSDGNYAYVTGHGDDSVSWFTRNPVTGALSYGLATDANYTLTQADLGKTITVVASYRDGGGYDHTYRGGQRHSTHLHS